MCAIVFFCACRESCPLSVWVSTDVIYYVHPHDAYPTRIKRTPRGCDGCSPSCLNQMKKHFHTRLYMQNSFYFDFYL